MNSFVVKLFHEENFHLIRTLTAEFVVFITCLIGDSLLAQQGLFKYPWARALADTLTHGLVALWSWVVVYPQLNQKTLFEIVLCFLLAVVVDSDHFIAAGSLNIHDATHLTQRPPFHNSTITILVTLLLLMFSHTMPLPVSRLVDHLPWIFYIAWSSHHLRDATRRGLWFWPFGSTKSIPKILYILLITLQAFVMKIYLMSRQHLIDHSTPKIMDI